MALLALALLGAAVSLVVLSIHQKIAATAGQYSSFCNVNETVNCDVVLASPQSYLLGLPVAVWALLTYGTFGVLTIGIMRASNFSSRLRMAQLNVALAVWGAIFSVYMAYVALIVIRAVCVMCTTMYVINAAVLAAAWVLYVGVRLERRPRSTVNWANRTRAIVAVAAGVAGLLVALAVWEAVAQRGRPAPGDLAEANAEFYRWYTAQPVVVVSAADGNSKGNADAPVTIVEFSDFECGHCAAAYRVLKQVLPRFGGAVRLVFRNFPLDMSCNASVRSALHGNACAAAVAAECAGFQGRFWQYHDRLFENQTALNRARLLQFAEELGLDIPAFTQCLQGESARKKVERDVQEGVRLGIDSTPTLFLNGRTIRGSLSPELLEKAIGFERARPHAGAQR